MDDTQIGPTSGAGRFPEKACVILKETVKWGCVAATAASLCTLIIIVRAAYDGGVSPLDAAFVALASAGAAGSMRTGYLILRRAVQTNHARGAKQDQGHRWAIASTALHGAANITYWCAQIMGA